MPSQLKSIGEGRDRENQSIDYNTMKSLILAQDER